VVTAISKHYDSSNVALILVAPVTSEDFNDALLFIYYILMSS
jgi:hypothetical protein